MALTKKIMGAVAAIALILTTLLTFAFKAVTENKATSLKRAGYFYKYNGPDYSEAEIRDYTNYDRSENNCEDGGNICGVFLTSDPSGTDHPVSTELDAVANNLWTSQQNGSSVNSEVISMKD